jgi:hypothetical protein
MLDRLFKFPVILVDVDNEEKKQKEIERMALPGAQERDYDIIYGEAEYPFHDFVGIEDRWIPNKESMQRALDGDFEACVVKFLNVVPQLVPWTKEKFKSEIGKFAEGYAEKKAKELEAIKQPADMRIIQITPEQLKELFQN